MEFEEGLKIVNRILCMGLKNPVKRNKRLLFFYGIFRRLNRLGINYAIQFDIFDGGFLKRKDIVRVQDGYNYEVNENRFINEDGFIEHQWELKTMRFGRYPMHFNGCEVIAAFNAISYLKRIYGEKIKLPRFQELISEFYNDGAALSAEFGTDPSAIRDYFKRNGYKVSFSIRQEEFDRIAHESEVSIISIFNDYDDIRKMVHTLCVTKKDGRFTSHNAPGFSGMVSAERMDELIKISSFYNFQGSGICIIGISVKDKANL